MFEFTCPRCQTTNRTRIGAGDQVIACCHCRQRLRVVPQDGGSPSRSGKQGAGWNSPLLAGFGGLAGLAAASLLLLAWYLAARKAPVEARPVPERIKEWAVASRPSTKKEDDAKGAEGSTRDQESRKDPSPSPSAEQPGLTGEQIADRLLKSACWIVAVTPRGGKIEVGSGSGTLVDQNERLILTNEHVANKQSTKVFVLFPLYRKGKLVTDNAEYLAEIKAGNGIKARVVRSDPRRDLTLLQLERLPDDVRKLPLASRPPQRGQQIHTLGGNPDGNQGQWIYSAGTVRAINTEHWRYDDGVERQAEVIASTVPINSGDSGGGVVNDRCLLVGVNNATSAGNANTRHICLTEVTDFLAQCYKEDLHIAWSAPTEDPVPSAVEKDVARLLDDLEPPDKEQEVRTKAADGLRDLGPAGREAIPVLVGIARNVGESETLREAAVEALKAIGAPSREHIPVVTRALIENTPPELRRYAATALGPVAAKDTDALTALVLAVKDRDTIVRQNVATSLGRVGGTAREKAMPALVQMLRDPEKNVGWAAFRALSQFEDPERSQIDARTEKQNLANPAVPVAARSYSCLLLGLVEEDATPAICEQLKENTDWHLALAVLAILERNVLERKKPKTKDVERALSRGLDHEDRTVRVAAARSLVNIGFDPVLFPAYLKAVSSLDSDVWMRPLALLKVRSKTSVFDNREALPLNLTLDSLESIKAALDGQDATARQVAAYALGTLGEEGAVAAPKLRAALKKETITSTRLEMLITFSLMGPRAIQELGGAGEALLDDLAALAQDVRADTRTQQVCAAIALVHLAPTSRQARQTYPILARAMLLKNASLPGGQTGGVPGGGTMSSSVGGLGGGMYGMVGGSMDSMGRVTQSGQNAGRSGPSGVGTTPPETTGPDPVERELHERAKQALIRGGPDAADALARACLNSFIGHKFDTPIEQLDKRLARKATFEILARIGPEANVQSVWTLLRTTQRFMRVGQEFPDVIAAANEAASAIRSKPSKK